MGDLGGDFTPDWQDKRENPNLKNPGFQAGSTQRPADLAGRMAQDALKAGVKVKGNADTAVDTYSKQVDPFK